MLTLLELAWRLCGKTARKVKDQLLHVVVGVMQTQEKAKATKPYARTLAWEKGLLDLGPCWRSRLEGWFDLGLNLLAYFVGHFKPAK